MSKRLLLLAVLFLAACAPPFAATPTPLPFTPEPTVPPVPMKVTVNGDGLPLAEYDAELQRYIAANSVLGNPITQEQAASVVLQNLIDQILLAQGAHGAGYRLDDAGLQVRLDELASTVGGPAALTDWQNAHGYTDESFRNSLRRSAEAAWMRDHIAAQVPRTAEQVHLRQILLYNEVTAQSVYARLQSGETFADLAAAYDPLTGGELGWVPRGYLLNEQIEQAVFELQAGQYTGVISADTGYHIVMVLERDPGRTLSPDALLVLQEKAVLDWVDQQRSAAEIIAGP